MSEVTIENGYYLVIVHDWQKNNSPQIIQVQDNIYYCFGSDECYNLSELEILAGPFTINQLKERLLK